MTEAFRHQHAAHCETGVMSSILRHHGLDVSEPMTFGLASGLAYAYLPMVKINGLPLISYRIPPRMIIRLLSRRIAGLSIRFKKFRNPEKGMRALDRLLDQGTLAGLQTSVFFLPYFPPDMRFHFNAHNLLVYEREGAEYRISDPVFSHLVSTDTASLKQARFAKGVLAPRGMMYYPVSVPAEIDFERLIPHAIKWTVRINGEVNPMPLAGIEGMRRVAATIDRLAGADPHYARLFLGQIVRMQEEIGTGGGGFRFMYAAFLQESAEILGSALLAEAADRASDIGDEWRLLALMCARMTKGRGNGCFSGIAAQLRKIAQHEGELYTRLRAIR